MPLVVGNWAEFTLSVRAPMAAYAAQNSKSAARADDATDAIAMIATIVNADHPGVEEDDQRHDIGGLRRARHNGRQDGGQLADSRIQARGPRHSQAGCEPSS